MTGVFFFPVVLKTLLILSYWHDTCNNTGETAPVARVEGWKKVSNLQSKLFLFFFFGASLYDWFQPSICSQYNEAFVQLLDIVIIIA